MLSVGLLSAKSAYADPHGVFFTVVGQQQLFFNILAALNQADYVEPLQLRQQLAQGRDTAGYAPSSDSRLRETATDLADVLTRQVSLEGQDVRTQERSDEYAREVVRQRRVAELISQYCREAFGSKDCEGFADQPADKRQFGQLLNERERSFVQDPLRYARLPLVYGAQGVLTSGTKEHQEAAQRLLDEAAKGGRVLPLAYSPQIAMLRIEADRLAKENKNNIIKPVLDGIIKGVEQSMLRSGPTDDELTELLRSIRFADDGTPSIQSPFSNPKTGKPLTPEEQIEYQGNAMRAWLRLPSVIRSLAEAGQKRVALQLETVDGAVPDRVQKVSAAVKGDMFSPGEITVINSAPANVKVGLQQQLLLLLGQLEGNPAFADPAQIDNPNGESAVDRENEQPLKVGTPLEPLRKANVIDRGLLPQSGVTEKPGLSQNFLQQLLGQIINKLGNEP